MTEFAGSPIDRCSLNNEDRRRAIKGLLQIHEYGYLHGDVRPSNILKDGSDIRYIDFTFATKIANPWEAGEEMGALNKILGCC